MTKLRNLLAVAFIVTLTACGGGGGGSSNTVTSSAEIEGNVYNTTSTASLMSNVFYAVNFLFNSAHALVDSSYSTLENIDTPIEISPITMGEPMEVSAKVTNTGNSNLSNVTIEIEIEHSAFLTPERWNCMKCYSYGSGEACNSTWEVIGGTLTEPQPEPALEVCDSTQNETSGYCVDVFDDSLDCTSPIWRIEYTPVGDGLFKATSSIPTLKPDESYNTIAGITMNELSNVRAGHYGRWKAVDAEGNVLDQSDYIFEVIQ